MVIEERVRADPGSCRRWNVSRRGGEFSHLVRAGNWRQTRPDGGVRILRAAVARVAVNAGSKRRRPAADPRDRRDSSNGNPSAAVRKIESIRLPVGAPLIFQIHLGSAVQGPSRISAQVSPLLYPSNQAYLAAGPVRNLFEACSLLPKPLASAATSSGLSIQPNARGMIYNAKMGDLVQLLGLVKAYAKTPAAELVVARSPLAEKTPKTPPPATRPAGPPPTRSAAAPPTSADASLVSSDAVSGGLVQPTSDAEQNDVSLVSDNQSASRDGSSEPLIEPESADGGTASKGEKTIVHEGASEVATTCFVFLLDRSVAEPSAADPRNAYSRLQKHTNDLLAQISADEHGSIEVAVVSYGLDSQGANEICNHFEDSSAGSSFVSSVELASVALRTDEVEEQVPNDFGRLTTRTIEKPVFVEMEPTAGGDWSEAFAVAAKLVQERLRDHPTPPDQCIILHLTRGQIEPAVVDEFAERLSRIQNDHAHLYHLIATEVPAKTLAYPSDPATIDNEGLRPLWQISSPLLGREQLALKRSSLSELSRGFVVNGKFDLLLAGLFA